jgi:hypothetical protein
LSIPPKAQGSVQWDPPTLGPLSGQIRDRGSFEFSRGLSFEKQSPPQRLKLRI